MEGARGDVTSPAAWAAYDYDVALEPELGWPGTKEEYEERLDQISPTLEELEDRDLSDSFLGH